MTSSYTYQDKTLDYQLIRKKRKSLGIYIDAYGHIELRVPNATNDEQIIKLLESKWKWILEKQQEMKARTAGHKDKVYEDGENFLYLGKSVTITIHVEPENKTAQVKLIDDNLLVTVPTEEDAVIKAVLKRFYYQQCKSLVEARIKVYQKHFKTKPRAIKISDNKKTWGTCNSLYELTFNWKLAMAPVDVIDYIVIHEMCHMVHLNHDRSFWRLVGKYMPDYEKKQQWLTQSHWKMIV